MSNLTIDEARDMNKLVYETPINPSVINKRTYKEYNFSNSSYEPGQTMQAIINSGGDAIWGPSSYINLKVKRNTANSQLGGKVDGTAYGLFKNVRLTHRSGEVLEDIRDIDKLACLHLHWATSLEDFEKNKQIMGNAVPGQSDLNCMLPLKHMLGCFSRTDQYLPPGFLAGAKLEFDLNTNARALVGDAGCTYQIASCQLVLDSADVYDSIKKDLLDEQMDVKKSGLQFSYPTYFSSVLSNGAVTALNIDIQRSASVTMMALIASQLKTVDTLDTVSPNDFNSYTITDWQFRLGSEYMPKQRTVSSEEESFLLTTQAFDGMPHQNDRSYMNSTGIPFFAPNGVSSYANGNQDDNRSVLAVSLEKSAAGLALTGEPTNNSRVLNFSAGSSQADSNVYAFLKYLRVANIMGDNVVVDA